DDVREVHEDALGRLGAEIVQARLVVDDAEVGLDEAGERTGLGPLAARAAVGAGDLGEAVLGLAALLLDEVLDQVVFAVAAVAAEALDQRIRERRHVPRRLPHGARQDDRAVEADHVAAAAHERLPPLAADVLLELGAEGAVVPGRTRSAVDLTRLE